MAMMNGHEQAARGHKPTRKTHRETPPPAKSRTYRGEAVDSPAPPEPGPQPVAPEARHAMIAEAAFYRAEQRGFEPGYELDDWLHAERDIERVLGACPDGSPSRCGD